MTRKRPIFDTSIFTAVALVVVAFLVIASPSETSKVNADQTNGLLVGP